MKVLDGMRILLPSRGLVRQRGNEALGHPLLRTRRCFAITSYELYAADRRDSQISTMCRCREWNGSQDEIWLVFLRLPLWGRNDMYSTAAASRPISHTSIPARHPSLSGIEKV